MLMIDRHHVAVVGAPTASESAVRSRIEVLVAVASEVIRSGLRAMLESLPDVSVVHECTGSRTALDRLESGLVSVIVTSPPLVDDDCRAIIDSAVRRHAKTVLLLRDYDVSDHDVITQALSLPADGYMLESGLTRASLASTLRGLDQDQVPMPAMLARGLLTRLRASEPKPAARPFLLTARELQVLSLLVRGQSNKEVARQLKVSEHGAKRHVACVLAKLNCPNRTAAVALVLQKGIINIP